MSTSFPPPVLPQLPQPPPPHNDTSSPPSATIVIIGITSAVIASVCLYLLFRFLLDRFHDRSFSIPSTLRRLHSQPNRHVSPSSKLLDSLPLFTFSSVSGNLTGGGDCAVCLSKFRKRDRLRLLPLCCHAFHAPCIDAWIASNQTCPLCRSKVFPSPPRAAEHISRVRSFRVEIGSISRREGGGGAAAGVAEATRSYAIGDSLEYVVDHENGYEVSAESSTTITTSSNSTVDKDQYSAVGVPVPAPPPGEVLGRSSSWVIMDYIPILYRAVSLRSSGRFFSGSMRRTDQDLEANRVGEEISEMFRCFSGF